MINPQDIAHLSKDEQIELLLSLAAQGEARAAAAEAERDEALAAVSGLAAQLSELRESYYDIVEKLKLANQRRFAPKSEKVVPGQLALFNDMDAASDPEAAEPAVEDAVGKVDLCQDFGHGSSRIYAATGSSSAAGFVRSKKASMAFAGIW